MKRIIPVLAVLALGGCAATSPQYVSQRQAEILAKAQATCSHVVTKEKNIACLNWAVGQNSYWGQGVRVVAAKDGSPRLVDYYHAPDTQYNVGGDMFNSDANPGAYTGMAR